MSPLDVPEGPCVECGVRPATCWWVGDDGSLAFARGRRTPWCELCVLDAQIVHAEEQTAKLSGLKAERDALRALEKDKQP